jgi:AraC-like DNA-binding protein
MISKAAIPAFHALLVRDLREPHFDPHWHFHPEYQLFVVLEGTGTRFVGDQVERFGPGDLVLTGPNLPHVWRSDEAYFDRANPLTTHGIVVYFRDGLLAEHVLGTQEGLKIKQLLDRSAQGLAFGGTNGRQVTHRLRTLVEAEGFDRILGLLHILDVLSRTGEVRVLSKEGFGGALGPVDSERMEHVLAYLMGRFTEPLQLADIAEVANMAPTAFCRYFKERTNKTLTQFIAELRIGYACKLLVEEDESVSRVSQESGYRTLSNFNRQFKAISGLTPREYRRQYAAAFIDAPAAEHSSMVNSSPVDDQ